MFADREYHNPLTFGVVENEGYASEGCSRAERSMQRELRGHKGGLETRCRTSGPSRSRMSRRQNVPRSFFWTIARKRIKKKRKSAYRKTAVPMTVAIRNPPVN